MTPAPKLVEWLVGALAPAPYRDAILGDLAELWHAQLCHRPRGRWTYWRQAFSLVVWARRAPTAPHGAPAQGPRGGPVGRMAQDLRYALRLARRQPGFTATALATLALGIAAATTIFTICDRVLIQPLPYAEPDRIVVLDNVGFGFTSRGMTVGRIVAASPALSAVGLYAPGGLNLGDPELSARINATAVTSGFFPALGTQPMAGRTFTREEERAFAPVAVVSFDLWRRHFGEDRGAIGRPIRLNSQAFTVVGVMPRGFDFPADTSVWVLVGSDQQITGSAFAPMVVARLAPGITLTQAADALARAEAAARPGASGDAPVVTPLKEELVGGARPTLLLLAALVALLLAATSANVAGLLLSRLRVRQRELSLRSALGASRARLAAQMTIECGALAAIGAGAGLVLTFWMLQAFEAAVPTFAPHVDLARPGLDVFVVAGLVAALSTVVAGAGPALAVLKKAPADVLREGASPTRRSRWFGQSLVVVQIAVALVLLVGTSATLAVLVQLSRVELGFGNARAIVFELTIPLTRYPTTSVPSLIADIESGLRALPGVSTVGVTDSAPGSTQTGIGMPIFAPGESERADSPGSRLSASLRMATPDYFRAMGIRMIAGRPFDGRDGISAQRVAILSESAARALAGEPAQAVGRRVQDRFRRGSDGLEVVGVVADVRLRRRLIGTQAQIYVPVAQSFARGSAGVVVDAEGDIDTVIARARDVLRRIDPELPIYSVLRMSDLRARYLATERLTVALTAAFGGLALALAAVGLYGLLSQVVSQQRREIGIRMALGANRGRLMRAVVTRSVSYAALGAVIGALALFAGSRAVMAFVPSFEAPTPAVLGLNVLILLVVSALAAWSPARRASRVDPLIALRAD